MNVKSILIIALLFNLKFDLYGQSQLFKLQITIYPDTSNMEGCFFSSAEINPVVEANTTKYNFDMKDLNPTNDHELYFGDFINSACKIVFHHNQLTEKALNSSSFIEPEIEINTAPLKVNMNVSRKTTADSKKTYELNVNLYVPSIFTQDDKLLKIMFNLTPLEQ